jgi:hypothetical protein
MKQFRLFDQVLAVDPNNIFASNSKRLASSEVTTNMTDTQRNVVKVVENLHDEEML